MNPCRVVRTLPPYSGQSEEVVPRPQSDPGVSQRLLCLPWKQEALEDICFGF